MNLQLGSFILVKPGTCLARGKNLIMCGINFILEAFSFNWCNLTLPLALLEANYFCLHYYSLLLLCRNSVPAIPLKCVRELKNILWKVIQLLSTVILSKLIHTGVYSTAIYQSLLYQQKFGISNLWLWSEILQEIYIPCLVIWSPDVITLVINQSCPVAVTLWLCLGLLLIYCVLFWYRVKETIKWYII